MLQQGKRSVAVGGEELGSLLLAAIDESGAAVEETNDNDSMGGSEDDGAGPVQQFGGVEDSENDEEGWLGPLGQPAIKCDPP